MQSVNEECLFNKNSEYEFGSWHMSQLTYETLGVDWYLIRIIILCIANKPVSNY